MASSGGWPAICGMRSDEHTSELQSRRDLVCRLLLEKKNLDYFRAINHSFTSQLQAEYDKLYPGTVLFTAVSAATGMYRGINFFFNDTATTEIYTLALHDALPI